MVAVGCPNENVLVGAVLKLDVVEVEGKRLLVVVVVVTGLLVLA